mmetsp:Transcript_21864/g.36102  ORF Transcript_21864/g.36102 Transcript_21864/m.36102 type:complete len:85 (+) Transcript_21864:35-289(+)
MWSSNCGDVQSITARGQDVCAGRMRKAASVRSKCKAALRARLWLGELDEVGLEAHMGRHVRGTWVVRGGGYVRVWWDPRGWLVG